MSLDPYTLRRDRMAALRVALQELVKGMQVSESEFISASLALIVHYAQKMTFDLETLQGLIRDLWYSTKSTHKPRAEA